MSTVTTSDGVTIFYKDSRRRSGIEDLAALRRQRFSRAANVPSVRLR